MTEEGEEKGEEGERVGEEWLLDHHQSRCRQGEWRLRFQ